ncbi:hypothetical protein K491DRAFT_434676 [Lophiostoma macrostomum CBS 122681]|uniref:Uncharacterized protein n=1 Tax=Lophiostoma macrostomum CBS 122681 TaxID=1314788 RepID=A0A6A6T8M5_9PLEO|nr:hypothetical protein K491DRAFT_434676 [Lophiostoma macrostomum CBS 122681]
MQRRWCCLEERGMKDNLTINTLNLKLGLLCPCMLVTMHHVNNVNNKRFLLKLKLSLCT